MAGTTNFQVRQLLAGLYGILALQPEYVQLLLQSVDANDSDIANFRIAKAARINTAKSRGESANIAVIPIYGVITKGGTGYYDEVSTDSIRSELNAALASPSVKGILLDISSPGGTVTDVPELADEIYAARAVKPIHAYSNGLAASAAYWLGSSASRFSGINSGYTGSVGVYIMHTDLSKMMESFGIDFTFISAGKYKVEANSYEPLSEVAETFLQGEVNKIYSQFLDSVARGRSAIDLSASDNFGNGRVFNGADAKKLGLLDSVNSFHGALVSLSDAIKRTPSSNVNQAQRATVTNRRAELMKRREQFLGKGWVP